MNSLRTLKRIAVNNWGLKLLALLLAGLTFYGIHGAINDREEYDVPLEVLVDDGIAILNQDPMTVRVHFSGSQDDILRLARKHIKAVIKPKTSNLDGTEQEVLIHPRSIVGATGVRVVKVEPAIARLTFDREIETEVSVEKPKTIGIPLIGTVEIEYEPHTVRIRGPKKRLQEMIQEGMNHVSTEPVDVDRRVESFTRRVRVLSPGGTWVSQIEPSEINVSVNIITKSTAREWKGLPVMAVMVAGDGREVTFTPQNVTVALSGRAEDLEKIAEETIMVFVNCVELEKAATYELPVVVRLPPGLDVNVEVTPGIVEVQINSDRAF